MDNVWSKKIDLMLKQIPADSWYVSNPTELAYRAVQDAAVGSANEAKGEKGWQKGMALLRDSELELQTRLFGQTNKNHSPLSLWRESPLEEPKRGKHE